MLCSDANGRVAYRKYVKNADAPLCKVEQEARAAKRGLWPLPTTEWIAPREFRHRKTSPELADISHETAVHGVASIGAH